MNILLYVMTMLMLMTTLTYARIQNYRSLKGTEIAFIAYMSTLEKKISEKSAQDWYKRIKISTKSRTSSKPERGTSRLSLNLLFKGTDKDKQSENYRLMRELAKNLMKSLYKEQEFFQKMEEKHPQFLDNLLDELQQASSNLPDEQKIKSSEEILNLELGSKELQEFFYRMNKGELSSPRPPEENISLETEEVEEEDSDLNKDEAHAPPGYTSLLDYITLKGDNKIRVFLAPEALLMAIFNNQDVVNNILDTRVTLYKRVRQQKYTQEAKDAAAQEFQSQFITHAGQFRDLLNFAVTSTNPSKYVDPN